MNVLVVDVVLGGCGDNVLGVDGDDVLVVDVM